MDSLFDPESLREHEGVEFHDETEYIHRERGEAAREDLEAFDSHVVVGVINEEGAVLLLNDSHHGWTLTAVPVEPGENWVAVGRRGVETRTGVAVEIDRPERVRRIDYCIGDDDAPHTTVYNVVFRTAPVAKQTVTTDTENTPDIEWFETVPDEQSGAVRDDIELFVD